MNEQLKHTSARCLVSADYSCIYCITQEKEFDEKSNLCYNCLRAGHPTRRCKLGPCKECKAWHNTILHDKFETRTTTSTTNAIAEASNETNTLTTLSRAVEVPTSEHVILSTAHILIADKFDNYHMARALLDCGSQTSFITKHLWKRLGTKN
ncbi:hypothetical protein JTB14_019585 [Gonioctena quinquepunctata]|nr:hypothetical protein JTB14_019585 [Gonioctena quinquepunctata]